MKNLGLPSTKSVKTSEFWVLVLIGSVVTVHLGLILRRINEPANINLLGTAILSWAILFLQVWSQRNKLNEPTHRLSTYLGLVILTLVIPISLLLSNSPIWLYVLPFISSFGIVLLSRGFLGLKQHSLVIVLIGVLSIPETVTRLMTGLPLLSAQSATFILSHLGFDVVNQGISVLLPTGGVNVDQGCSGAVAMFQLFRIALLFLVFFPTPITQNLIGKILVPLVAVTFAFIVNSFRVALLAILAAKQNNQRFDYWHTGEGSHIFSLTSVILFGLFCYFLISLDKRTTSN